MEEVDVWAGAQTGWAAQENEKRSYKKSTAEKMYWNRIKNSQRMNLYHIMLH